MRASRLLAVPAVAAFGLAACGGGDDDSGPTKADFIVRADAICTDLQAKGDALERQNPRSPRDLVAYAERADEFVTDGLERFRSIELPEDGGDRAGAEGWIAELDRAADEVGRLRTDASDLQQAVRANDRERVRRTSRQLQATAREVKRAGDAADRKAKAYGLKECGDGS